MKMLVAEYTTIFLNRSVRANLKVLFLFITALASLVTTYAIAFHYIMEAEGRAGEHSWVTGFYWTLTVMSTLGFGDITFTSDFGRAFSMVVLLSGMIFMLVLLPFVFIEFFAGPWFRAQQAARTPTVLAPSHRGHVILTQFDSVTRNLMEKLTRGHRDYVLITADREEALRLHDEGYKVMVGDLDNPTTYRHARIEQAALIATTGTDPVNTAIAFTVRELSPDIQIISTASSEASVDIMELAGANSVLQLGRLMGQSLARRVIGGQQLAHIVGGFDGLHIAEATVASTELEGKTLRDTNLRQETGVVVLGLWERGQFTPARPESELGKHTVLVLAGNERQIEAFNTRFAWEKPTTAPVVIIGGGRVGRACGQTLAERGIDYRIVERNPERIRNAQNYVQGDAADLSVLREAGIMETQTVVITTHDDAINIYLSIYCRRLRPDIRVITRAVRARNISTLHRAGTDFVMSYASMGANAIYNLCRRGDILMVAEGLDIFRVPVPRQLKGKTLLEGSIRPRTDCSVVAIEVGDEMNINPDPLDKLPDDAELILIGTDESRARFFEIFSED